jgi:hypothetical protein
MMRLALNVAFAALLAASIPVAVDAQRGGGGGRGNGSAGGTGSVIFRSGTPRAPMPVLGDIGSINRPMGADINGIQTTPPPGFGRQLPSPFTARPGTYTRLHQIPLGIPYGYGYDPFYEESTYEKLYRVPEQPLTTGTLFLDVTPASASVLVDTAYVGNASDLEARGVTLSAGHHLLALEAPGFDRKTIEVVVNAGEPLRYRYDMTPTQIAAASVAPARPPQTMYLIPGCYGGNRQPTRANLPAGCDIAKLQVRRPPTRTN